MTEGRTCHGVRDYGEDYPVQLVLTHGRISICATNEGGNNVTLVDLWDLMDWLRLGPKEGRHDAGFILPLATPPDMPASD